jgi:hypothetical protein
LEPAGGGWRRARLIDDDAKCGQLAIAAGVVEPQGASDGCVLRVWAAFRALAARGPASGDEELVE